MAYKYKWCTYDRHMQTVKVMIYDKACCKPSVLCEQSIWLISLPGKLPHVCNIAYNHLQENFIALPVTRLAGTGTPVWSRVLQLSEKRKARGTLNSLSNAEMCCGLSQQLPRTGWVPGLHSGCFTLPWEGGSVSGTQKQLSDLSQIWSVAGCLYHGSASSYTSLLLVGFPHVGPFSVSTVVCIISLFYWTTSKWSEEHCKYSTLIEDISISICLYVFLLVVPFSRDQYKQIA